MRLRLVLTTLTACLGLAACGEDESTPDPTAAVKGNGYTVTPPEGWTDGSSLAVYVPKPDTVLVEPEPEDGFTNEIIIRREDGRDFSADDIAKSTARLSKAGGDTPEGGPTRSQIDGDEAVELVAKTEKGQSRQQLQVSHGGSVFTILLTSREPEPELFQAFRESWVWTG